MKKPLLWSIGIILVVVGAMACIIWFLVSSSREEFLPIGFQSSISEQSPKVVKFGLILPLVGEKMERGMEIQEVYASEIEAFNASHTGKQILLVVTNDEHCQGDKGIDYGNKFEDKEVNFVVRPDCVDSFSMDDWRDIARQTVIDLEVAFEMQGSYSEELSPGDGVIAIG